MTRSMTREMTIEMTKMDDEMDGRMGSNERMLTGIHVDGMHERSTRAMGVQVH